MFAHTHSRAGRSSAGFTLIELMIAVAILAIIAAVAIPAYKGYIRESRLGAMRMNLDTLRIAVEAYRLDNSGGTYGSKGAVYSKTVIGDSFGWMPEGDANNYYYGVNTQVTTYTICAAADVGASIRCRKAGGAFSCTEGTYKTAQTACP
jgi:prepilin-type N-terminal cleavage/methylation domain-containing protein